MTLLTEEMVLCRTKQADIASIKMLNLWGNGLTDVSVIRLMRDVEILALSSNSITTLEPFESCTKLKELFLRKNLISDINEIAYLQSLPSLWNLWLEENPCCERAGPNYRLIVLHALPQLKKLDNVNVTNEEVNKAMRLAGAGRTVSISLAEEKLSGDYAQQAEQRQLEQQHQQQHQQQQQQQLLQQQQQQQQQQQTQQQPPQSHQSLQRTTTPPQQIHQRQQPSQEQEYSPRSVSPQKERSPGSDRESSPNSSSCYRERAPIPPSMSTHSMKEYYQSDRPASYSAPYRHSQNDLTEWEEHQQGGQYTSSNLCHGARRSGGVYEREQPDRYVYRNGHSRENGDWDEGERPRPRRCGYSDSPSGASRDVSNYLRHPVVRCPNLLSAALCIIKELDFASLEVVEMAVHRRLSDFPVEYRD